MEDGIVKGNLVRIVPAKKHHWMPAEADGRVMLTHAFHGLACFVDVDTRQYITGLDEKQEKYFEEKLNLEKGALNRYNGKFWATFHPRIDKNGLTLDLDNPYDELVYVWMKNQQFVATSPTDQLEKPWAEYVITSEVESAKLDNLKRGKVKDAIKKADKFSVQDMMDYLMVLGKTVNKSSSIEFIQASFDKEVMDNPENFLRVTDNIEDYRMHVFIRKCAQKRILTLVGQGYKITGDDKILGSSLSETIENLRDPINSEIFLNLKTKLEMTIAPKKTKVEDK